VKYSAAHPNARVPASPPNHALGNSSSPPVVRKNNNATESIRIVSYVAMGMTGKVLHHILEKEKNDDSQDDRKQEFSHSERGRLGFFIVHDLSQASGQP
jgi:hypothetical protein